MKIPLRSKTTGKIGQYPASHADMSSDLEPVENVPVCEDCTIEPEPELESVVYWPVEYDEEDN